jgi:hypothetical protein
VDIKEERKEVRPPNQIIVKQLEEIKVREIINVDLKPKTPVQAQ